MGNWNVHCNTLEEASVETSEESTFCYPSFGLGALPVTPKPGFVQMYMMLWKVITQDL